MADPASTTGDIRWSRLDPQTWYLYNQPPDAGAGGASMPTTEPPPEPDAAAADTPTAAAQPLTAGAHRAALNSLVRSLRRTTDTFPGSDVRAFSPQTLGQVADLIRQGTITMGSDTFDLAIPWRGSPALHDLLGQAVDYYRDWLRVSSASQTLGAFRAQMGNIPQP